VRVYVAFLRGINVGGHNTIKMAALVDLVRDLGFGTVSTLLQSGNVVFTADGSAATIAARLESGLADRFDLSIPVVVRSADALRAAVDAAPFTKEQLEQPNWALVYFLAATRGEAPADRDATFSDRLRATHTGPETATLIGRQLYVFYPAGIGRSKLDNGRIDRLLGTIATGRNWSTLANVLARCRETKREH